MLHATPPRAKPAINSGAELHSGKATNAAAIANGNSTIAATIAPSVSGTKSPPNETAEMR